MSTASVHLVICTFRYLIPMVLIAGFPACNSRTDRLAEFVQLEQIQFQSISADLIHLDLDLAVQNPRAFPITIKSFAGEVALSGELLGSGRFAQNTELAAHTVTKVRMPVTIESKRLTAADFDALFSAEIPYRLRGNVELEHRFGVSRSKLDLQGKIQAPAQMHVTVSSNSATGLVSVRSSGFPQAGLSGVQEDFELQVVNPFAFAIPLKSLTYRVEINSQVVGEGALPAEARLQPGDNRLKAPLRAHPVNAVKSLFGGLLSGEAPRVDVSGTFVIAHKERELIIDVRTTAHK